MTRVPLTLLLVGAAGLGGCAPAARAANAAPAPVAIAVAPARPAGTQSIYSGPGIVAAAHTYKVGFEVTGRVASVAVDVGDRVHAGQVLATLDRAQYADQLAAAQARAAAAAALAAKAANGSRAGERESADRSVAAARAQVARASAALTLADQNIGRLRPLLESGDIPRQRYDEAVAAQRDAAAALAAAQAQAASVNAQRGLVAEGARPEDRAAARADAAAARANAALAETTLAKTAIVAPADGVVQLRAIQPGDQAQPGAAAITITDTAEPDIIVAVPETRIHAIHVGTIARVVADNEGATARVTRIEPDADPQTRTYRVRLRAPALALVPGGVVDVTIGVRTAAGASVPVGALLGGSEGRSVAVYDAAHRTIVRRVVSVSALEGDRAIVRGIAAGTPIVIAGATQARPGQPVRVVPFSTSEIAGE